MRLQKLFCIANNHPHQISSLDDVDFLSICVSYVDTEHIAHITNIEKIAGGPYAVTFTLWIMWSDNGRLIKAKSLLNEIRRLVQGGLCRYMINTEKKELYVYNMSDISDIYKELVNYNLIYETCSNTL